MEKVGDYVLDAETEFLASKQETGHEWELFKENVRPLKRGRNVNLLNNALKSTTDYQLKKALLDNRRALIEAIDHYKGEDPLHPWLQCIKWVQEAFPPGGDSSGLIVIYEQCVRTFWHDDRYKDDLRYLKVWLEYAENCIDGQVIYSFLEANKIGLTHSSFYIAYALHMESQNKFKTANEIFNRGLSMNAVPEEKLKAAYKKFLSRSMGRPKAAEEELTEHQLSMRSFGTLLARGEARHQTTGTSELSRKKMKQDRAQGSLFSIYKDANAGMSSTLQSEIPKLENTSWHCLGARADRNKENQAIPSKWTSNKIPQRHGLRNRGATTTTPCLEIFVDEECAKTQEKESAAGVKVSSLPLRRGDDRDIKKETELLRENPLRYFPPSSLPR